MSIIYDPKLIIVLPEVRDENGNVIRKEITLEDHYKSCDGCPYCD